MHRNMPLILRGPEALGAGYVNFQVCLPPESPWRLPLRKQTPDGSISRSPELRVGRGTARGGCRACRERGFWVRDTYVATPPGVPPLTSFLLQGAFPTAGAYGVASPRAPRQRRAHLGPLSARASPGTWARRWRGATTTPTSSAPWSGAAGSPGSGSEPSHALDSVW